MKKSDILKSLKNDPLGIIGKKTDMGDIEVNYDVFSS